MTQEERDQLADDLGYLNYRCPRHGRFQSDTGPHCPRCDEIDDENRRIPDGADDAARLLDAKDTEIADLNKRLEHLGSWKDAQGYYRDLTNPEAQVQPLLDQIADLKCQLVKAEADSRRLLEAIEEVLSWVPAIYQSIDSSSVTITWAFYTDVRKKLRATIDAAMSAQEPK